MPKTVLPKSIGGDWCMSSPKRYCTTGICVLQGDLGALSRLRRKPLVSAMGIAGAPPTGGQKRLDTSPDGNTWTPQHSGTTQDLYDVDWSGSLFVVVGQNGTILTSFDGNTWTPQHPGTTQDIASIACSSSLFVAIDTSGMLTSS
jgi:hypothetical protein